MKTKYTLAAFSAIILILSGFHGLEDPAFVKQLKAALARYHSRFPEEKVYVQFDKTFYKPGDDIWFNVFVANSNTNQPSDLSDVVYVDLIDPKGNMASRSELLLREGTAPGDFALENTSPGGVYKVRAYTQWNKNFGEQNIFEKALTVQKVITPRLLLKLDFTKEAYGPADRVITELVARDLKNNPAVNATIDYSIQIGGKKGLQGTTVTGANGKARIEFDLPADLGTPDGLLLAKITYSGIEESISRSIPIVLNKISVSFFPEGGHWVEGIRHRVAFKALNESGKSADIAGYIVDEDNTTVCSFESFHMGMGAFELTPEKGKKYYARIVRPVSNGSLTPLPPALSSGFTFNLKSSDESASEWNIHSPETAPAYLVAQMHGEIFYAEPLNLKKGQNFISVPQKGLGRGIAVFTLFDNSGLEQNERLVFVNSQKKLNIRVEPEKTVYSPGEKVTVGIRTTDENGKGIPARISFAVVDDQLISFADDKQDNILSSLLLTSELKGKVQEPAFYFDPDEADAEKALDHLMMTQGWRRFTWQEVQKASRMITYFPEKVKNLSGMLKRDGQGAEGEVSLLELGNKRRALTLRTTRDGHFTFRNIDPSVPLLLLTKKPGELTLQKERPLIISFNDKDGTTWIPERVEQKTGVATVRQGADRDTAIEQEVLDLRMDEDVQELSEVVVTGFGYLNKRSLSASIATVHTNAVDNLNAPGLESSLQGRVSGIIIQPQSATPAARYSMSIRGNSSLTTKNEPLYVIDGHPIGTSLNQNFANGSMIGIEDIETVEVINSPEASALFGSAAGNGAILITTASRLGYSNFYSTRKAPRYNSMSIPPRKFSAVREFYSPPPSENKEEARKDFRTTIYWNPEIITDEKGVAKVTFFNNDAVSAFRITAEGFTAKGLLGRAESVFTTAMPLSIDTRIPDYLGFEDVLRLPVIVRNESAKEISATVSVIATSGVRVKESRDHDVILAAGAAKVLYYTILPQGIEGEFPITIKLRSKDFEDEMNHTIRVRPVGFPVAISFSGKDRKKDFQFDISNAEQGTLKAELNAFPDVLGDLFTGAESILRQPYGCFEQVSSSNYPNILALQFLQKSGLVRPEVEKRANAYIRDGYKRLAAYEIKGGGFEWFGHPPAHEGLTAYGLIQFYEMKKIYPNVDETMIERTRTWLLSRRDNKGGFKQNTGKYGFSAASSRVNNAYLVYALAETGTKDIIAEYNKAFAEAMEGADDYRMALMANAAFSLGRMNDYNKLIGGFKQKAKAGFQEMNLEHSIVRSYGESLKTEAISLWAIAVMKDTDCDVDLVQQCIRQILGARLHGGFGSTQATALALKALSEYARLVRTARDDGRITIMLKDKVLETQKYSKEETETLVMNDFQNAFATDSPQSLSVLFEETDEPLPYTLNLQWHTRTPPSHAECKVDLSTSLSSATVKATETVRLAINLRNKVADGLPMTVAVIGLPAGLSVQPWQLKEKQEAGEFDFYEILDDKLVLYYKELGPEESHLLYFDLKAEIPGTYKGAASSAYLYYTDEHKTWVKGNAITVN